MHEFGRGFGINFKIGKMGEKGSVVRYTELVRCPAVSVTSGMNSGTTDTHAATATSILLTAHPHCGLFQPI